MKNLLKTLIYFIFICLFVLGAFMQPFVSAQTETPVTETSATEAPTETPLATALPPTAIPEPTATLEPTEAPPTPFARPLVVIRFL